MNGLEKGSDEQMAQWSYPRMEELLQRHLRQYSRLGKQHSHYRKIKRQAILIWIGWMRKVRAGEQP